MPDGGISEAVLLSMLTGAEFAPAAAAGALGASAGAAALPTVGAALAGDATASSLLPALSGYGASTIPGAGLSGLGLAGDGLLGASILPEAEALGVGFAPTVGGISQEAAMLEEGAKAGGGLPKWMTLGNAKDALGAGAAGKSLMSQPETPIVPGQMPQRPQPQQGVFPSIAQVLDQTALQQLRRKRMGLL